MKWSETIHEITHIGDLFAIPFFIIGFLYFYFKKNKNCIEFLIMVFLLIAFLFDSIFSIRYLFFNERDE